MNSIEKTLYLINSAHSIKAKKDILKKELKSYGVDDFKLENHICTVSTKPAEHFFNNTMCFNYGETKVTFKYDSASIISESSIKSILCVFLISAENSIIVNDIVSLNNIVKYNLNNNNALIQAIQNEIEVYKRYNQPFCLLKIVVKVPVSSDKIKITLKHYLDIVKDNVRTTDEIFCDKNNIYILLKNIKGEDGEKILKKLNEKLKYCTMGIAEWANSYVIVDLFSEVENYIYLNGLDVLKNTESDIITLNKILNKAILHSDSIIVVDSCFCSKKHQPYKAMEFSLKGNTYYVLSKYKNIAEFSDCYIFNYEDIAEDIFEYFKKRS